jgi:Flp pilus assembly pilin Flp
MLRSFLSDTNAVTCIEYGLIAAVIALVFTGVLVGAGKFGFGCVDLRCKLNVTFSEAGSALK